MPLKSMCMAVVVALVTGSAFAETVVQNPLTESPTWEDLRFDVVGDADLAEGNDILSVEAPSRAADAATVPVVLTQTNPNVHITAATVVIDENPAPVAGVFTFGDGMGELSFEMRLRVNQYSNVRVITQTEDGLSMTGRFVKASGGCSAPASRDPESVLASMGEMKLRLFGEMDAPLQSNVRREAQIMVRHPNYSGLQRDQITQLFIPAHFIDHLEVWQGDDMLWAMDGGISISENPAFRFGYIDNGSEALTVKATDTSGNSFEQVLPKGPAT